MAPPLLNGPSMKKFVFALGLIALVVGVAWGIRAVTVYQANARASKFNNNVESLFNALQQYKERTGSYPHGSNAEIARALDGKNEKNLIILVGKNLTTNTKGEFVDPWETPLRIYFSGDGVLVRSAGPNRSFDDTTVVEFDDILRSN
jgi:type II secretory pathway pseudopilin PulG